MAWIIIFTGVLLYVLIARRVYVFLVYKTHKGRDKKDGDMGVLEDFLNDTVSDDEFDSVGLCYGSSFWPIVLPVLFLILICPWLRELYLRFTGSPESLEERLVLKLKKEKRNKRGKPNG